MYLGPYRAVCVYDYDIAKEMFSKEEASGRPDIFVYNHRMLNKRLGKFTHISYPVGILFNININFKLSIKCH